MCREDVRATADVLHHGVIGGGDLVPQNPFAPPVHVIIPQELADEASLRAYLGISDKELRKVRWARARMYQLFEISKSNGRTRWITAPDRRLKFLQRRLLPLLDQLYSVRNPVHGFVAGRSVKTNAAAHLRKRFVLNLDLKDFFPSISESRITGVLRSIGVPRAVADAIGYLTCVNGQLPQGAPTSPVMSNMICFRMDRELLDFAKASRCIYTRYADDITFSSHQPMTALFESILPPAGPFAPELLAPKLVAVLADNGFTLNPAKAHYADRHSRRMVTGIKVNELLNVDRRFVRNIRAVLHSIETLGLQAAQERYEEKGGKGDLASHLLGKISWLRHIRGQTDPVFRSIALRFNAAPFVQKITVLPTVAEVRDRAVWVVEHFDGEMAQGSAFFLSGIGLVTAAHCVAGAAEIEVYHPGKPANKFKASVIAVDEHRDLAILGHTIPVTEYLELAAGDQAAAVGDVLTAIGYPGFGPGDRLNVREGKVASLSVKHGVGYVEVTQKLSQGMSGGPLIDSNERAVGVIHKGGAGEQRDLAISIAELIEWHAKVATPAAEEQGA
jgi:S1-C subfamily serine protease